MLLCISSYAGIHRSTANLIKKSLSRSKKGNRTSQVSPPPQNLIPNSGPEWKGKSGLCFDLINKMICNAEDRLSAEDVLKHPWMQIQDDVPVPEKSVLKENYQNI